MNSIDLALRSSIPPLTREREIELFERWRTRGDLRAREAIAASQLQWVARLASKHASRSVLSAEDLFAEGLEALAIAMTRFDPANGARFGTYATIWIRRWLGNAIAVSVTPFAGERSNRAWLSFAIRKQADQIVAADNATLAKMCQDGPFKGVGTDRMREMAMSFVIGMPASMDDDSGLGTLHGRLFDSSSNPESAVSDAEDDRGRETLAARAMDALTGRERFIVRSTLLCESDESVTLDSIGKLLGVSRERVRQVQRTAVKKMRDALGVANQEPYRSRARRTA